MNAVETIIEAEGWRSLGADPEDLVATVYAACARVAGIEGGAAILLTDDAALRALNARFRGLDKATNVLSFPADGTPDGFLGDVALAWETCSREAAEKGVSPSDHAAHLIAHGLLHLVGYDHEHDGDALKMESLETQILDALGVADPYRETS